MITAVTADAPFRSAPRISRARFRQVLTQHAAPAVLAERDGGAYWDAIVAYDVDPLFVLAMFEHESGMGTAGVAVQTRSWGNTRAPSFGAEPIGTVPGRTGHFPVFASWLDGCRATAARLAEPSWVYAGRATIRDVFLWPADPLTVWAPAGDLNDPAGYVSSVLRDMNAWSDLEGSMTPWEHVIPGLVDIRGELATAAPNEGGVPRGPYERIPLSQKRGVVVHFRGVVTPADQSPGYASFQADAVYHVGKNWAARNEAPVFGSGIMYHVGIGFDGTAYLLRDLDRVLWHCGAWPQNANTLAIQLPLGPGQRATPAQLRRLAEVCDAWLEHTGAPRREVWGHQELRATDCPGTLLGDFVRPYRAGALPPVPPAPTDDGDPWFLNLGERPAPFALRRGFRALVATLAQARHPQDPNSAALALVGAPLEEEWYGVDGRAYQRCERVTLCYVPGWAPPWDVHVLPVSAALPERRP